ncbi:E3 ubiquitin-protein ligase HUWE1 [Pseudohyphozyma bogoriensis]|nr:E3 ubiquitin-protein ligase HUWE1 [Pseudohyphozyma bogoriensis]
MKIKRQPKRTPSSNAAVAAFIVQLNEADPDALPQLLAPIIRDGWAWPRTDLQHWINPLNRFDAILDEIIRDYDLGSMEHSQLNAFTPRTKDLLASILAFEKVLLENSTNRKIFASFDRLNDLLHTTDISILLATLRLALRPAQQFSTASQNGLVTFGVSEKRLLDLAQGWGTRDYGLEMVDLATDDVSIPPELDDAEWQFYRKAVDAGKQAASGGGALAEPATEKKDKGKEVDAMEVEEDVPTAEASTSTSAAAPATPAPKPRAAFAQGSLLATPIPATPGAPSSSAPTEGLTTILLGNVGANPSPAVDILADAVDKYDVPIADRLNLLQKIRIAKSLRSTSDRRTMLVVRLLAIAVIAHTNSEAHVQTKLFLYEPELISQLAELVHPDRNVPVEIQAASFYALDAIAKFKNKTSEVASALNASVTHGILMYVLRRTVADLEGDSPTSTPEFIDSLFNILSFFQTNSFVGNMIVGAGVTSTLVDFVNNQRRDRLSVVTKAITFLDSLMYGYSSAFSLFISIGGLPVFVERVKDEIEVCIEAHSSVASTSKLALDTPTGLLSFEQAALLKALLRAIQRLMQTAGTTEGLRNLIDTSLPASVRSIMTHRDVFGPQIFGLAINITATFIHNEPTCLTTIQEAKIPEALYDAIEDSIPVLQAIPNAIGALCLNPAGLTQFNTRDIIPRYFSTFTSERHVRLLQERDNSTMIGTCVDELIRHHPSLKEKVLGAALDALKTIREQGKAFVPESSEGYALQRPKEGEDVAMDVSEPPAEATPATPLSPAPAPALGGSEVADGAQKPEDIKENIIMTSVDVMGRFLEGLFQNLGHCKDFIRLDPIPIILDIFALPCAPHTSPNTPAFVSMSTLFRVMSEVKPPEVAAAVLKEIKAYLEKTSWFWSGFSVESRLTSLVAPSSENFDESNARFRDVSILLTYVAFLYDLYGNLVYAHGKVSTLVLGVIGAPAEHKTLMDLGALHRACLWEGILLKNSSSSENSAAEATSIEAGADLSQAAEASTSASTLTEPAASTSKESSSAPTPSQNSKAVQQVVAMLPQNIAPFFQAASKMFVHRRSGDTAHRKASSEVANAIAAVMVDSLAWPESPSLANNLAYSTLMISLVTSLLFDDRATSAGIQTLLLVAFQKVKGLDLFIELYTKYYDITTELLAATDDSAKLEVNLPIVHAFAGLKIALDLLHRLSSHRTLLEAPQTALLLSLEKDKSSPDYFEPHEFLITLRSTILPSATATWNVPWLRKSPPNVVRNLVGALVNILRAEGENPPDPSTLAPPQPQMPFGAMGALLMEMGFPRAACRTALIRCRNSVPMATEYLLSHPDIVGDAREQERQGNADDEAAAPNQDNADGQAQPPADEAAPVPADQPVEQPAEQPAEPAVEQPADQPAEQPAEDVEMEAAPASVLSAEASEESKAESDRALATKAAKASLDAAREQLKPSFLSKALSLAEEYSELVFDIKGAFNLLYPTTDDKAPSLTPLLEDLAQVEAAGSTDQAVATRLRVIALLSADATYRDTIEGSREELMKVLMKYQREYTTLDPVKDNRPKWLAPATLIADTLFSLAEVPRATDILTADQAVPAVELVAQGPDWKAERSAFFDLAFDILKKGSSDREIFISCLRLLLVLTRDHDLAARFVQQDGLPTLFSALSVDKPETEGCHPFAVMILRHVIEDQLTLKPIMEREIEAWFAQPRAKVADITGFLRGSSSIAFRNVPVFLEAARTTCKLVRADAPGHYHVALQNEATPDSKVPDADAAIKSPFSADGQAASGEELADEASTTKAKASAPSSQSTETAIHYLLGSILDLAKVVLTPSLSTPAASTETLSAIPSASEASSAAPPALIGAEGEAPKSTPTPPTPEPLLAEYGQLSFAMSSLSELLSSYASCKTSFLTFSTKRIPRDPTKELTTTAPKSRSSFLYFLLNDVIPVGSVVPPKDSEAKRRSTLSMWATLIVVSLCYDPDAGHFSKDSSADITTVRKGVLDAISRAFKEATASTESTDVRYGRLQALSDLCYRLLTSRPFPSASKTHDETSMQLAKLMLEKNFAVILTNALAEVDLNFPSVNNLINSILRPLEQLTKVVTKVGRAKSSAALPGALDGDVSTEESSMDEDDVDVDSEEEETPDLYRNSALGMYEGELEPGNQDDAYMSGDSEGEYDDEDAMMEELEDGLVPGSDVSDVSEDEDDEDDHSVVEEAYIDSDDEEEMEDGDDEHDHEIIEVETDSEDDDDEDGSEGELEMELNAEDLDQEDLDALNELAEADEDADWLDEEGGDDGEGDAGEAFELPGAGAPLRDGEEGDSDGDSYADDEMMYGELEFDADMTEQMNAGRAGAASFGWDMLGGDGSSARRSRLAEDMMLGDASLFGGRSRSSAAPQAPAHPLLIDTPAVDGDNGGPSRRQRRNQAQSQDTPEYQAWVQQIERAVGVGAVEALQELLGSYGLEHLTGPEQIRLAPGPDGGIAMVIDRSSQVAPGGGRSRAHQHSAPRSGRHGTDRASTSQFFPVVTTQRWQEEGRIMQGSVLTAERIARLTNHLINVLHPAAREAARLAKEAEVERIEKEAREQEKRDAEQKLKDEEEAREKAKAEEEARRVEEEEARRVEEEEASAAAAAAASEAAAASTEMEVESGEAMEGVVQDDVAEVLRLANSLAAGLGAALTPSPATPAPAAAAPEVEAPAESEASGSGSGAAERVMITIDGREVDITDTGIDPTFLEALPDDMRQEVLNQHFRETRSAGPPPAVPSSINSEFLDALPPDLRAEVLRQEAAEQRREQAASRAAQSGAAPEEPAGPLEIDPATFFASLDPRLREEVLLDQEDGFLQTLPSNLVAEANAMRDQLRRDRHARNPGGAPRIAHAGIPVVPGAKKAPVHREAIQLLDKSGLATLVRLLFFPQPLRKNALQKVLVNLCENSRTRMELINLLLTILQDGTRDVSAVDKSFSQMSLRASKSLATKDTPRRKVGLETPGGGLPHFPGESVPNLIAQRCLDALMFLISSNDQSPLFFLTEQEITVGLSRRQSKKGKGKEKAAPSVTFPIVVLLGLLDRPALLKTQSMMDALTQLLSGITKSLSVLQKKSPEEETPAPPAVEGAPSTEGTLAPAPSTGAPSAPPVEGAGDAADPNAPKDAKDAPKEALTSEVLIKNPPQIPPSILRLVVNILDAGECSSRTFQQTLVLIQNLSYLPGARDSILEELKSRAQSLADQLLPDLDELVKAIQGGEDVRSVTLAKFSPASSLQAKLLRILKTIDHSPPKKSPTPDVLGPKKLSPEEEKVRDIYDAFAFGGLWERLGRCLTAIEEKPDLSYIGNVLLPLIEAIMVVSKFIGRRPPKDAQSPGAAMSPASTGPEDPTSIEGIFIKFTDDHRRTINQLVRSNPGLMSGSFAVLAKNSSILDFDTKRNFFFSRLHDRSLRQRNHYGTLQVNVRRQHVFEDSFHVLQRRTGDEIKHGKLNVKFYDEEGVDAGGVTREWFSVLARQMFNPGYALFQPQAADALTYQPNKSSSINDEHLAFFQFVGRIIGKALHDQRILEAYFSRAMYKHMLGKPVDHRDLESIDPEYHKSLVWMLENDIDGVLELTFSVERDDFGATEIVDLIPDGRNVAVTNENKAEYVRLIADQRLSVEIKDQMAALLKGLYEIVPKDLLQIFSEKELELLISGMPEIDVDEWRANTDLHNFSPTHPVIGYFWRALLQFVSGSSRVPLEGFASLQGMSGVTKFSITAAGETSALPTAHTCFNQLDLPTGYSSYEELRKALLLAITEGATGFAFA